MSPDRLIGLAYVASRFHSGQRSRGYRILSRIEWSPRGSNADRLLPRGEWWEARTWAAHYMRFARRKMGAF